MRTKKKIAPAAYIIILAVVAIAGWQLWPKSGGMPKGVGKIPPAEMPKVIDAVTATSTPTVSAKTMSKTLQSLSAPPQKQTATSTQSQEELLKKLQAPN